MPTIFKIKKYQCAIMPNYNLIYIQSVFLKERLLKKLRKYKQRTKLVSLPYYSLFPNWFKSNLSVYEMENNNSPDYLIFSTMTIRKLVKVKDKVLI